MLINEVAGEIKIIDIVADAIYNFIISSDIELDAEGKILDELFRRSAKNYGLRWRGTTLRDLQAKLAVLKRLERRLRISNPETQQKRADTRQKNKIAKAEKAAVLARAKAEKDAAWFRQEYSKMIAPRGSSQVKSLE